MLLLAVIYLGLGICTGAYVFKTRIAKQSDRNRLIIVGEFSITAVVCLISTAALSTTTGWLAAIVVALSLAAINQIPRVIAGFVLDTMPEAFGVLEIPFLEMMFFGIYAMLIWLPWQLCLFAASFVLPSLAHIPSDHRMLFAGVLTVLSLASIISAFVLTKELDSHLIA